MVPPLPLPAEPQTMEVVLAAFTALGYALSARSLLLLALIGGFVLALLAIGAQTQATLFVLVAYCILLVLPIVYLEVRKQA
jgi:hypothetical protein